MATSVERYITVQPGDRIDILAFRVYGDSTKYDLLIRANPELDIWNPEAGSQIKVPNAR